MATARTPRPVLSFLDHLSRRWLVRNRSRYLAELDALAVLSQAPGLYYLNVQYEWGCTTAIKPAPEDARRVSCARSTGTLPASAHLSSPHALPIRWVPGSRSLGRPSQGCCRRSHRPVRPRSTSRCHRAASVFIPSTGSSQRVRSGAHLTSSLSIFSAAFLKPRRIMPLPGQCLKTTPIATPAIFTLVGVRADEGVVVERDPPKRALTDTHAANEWRTPTWQPGHHRAYENDARLAAMRATPSQWDLHFGWLTWPLLNAETRLAMVDRSMHAMLARNIASASARDCFSTTGDHIAPSDRTAGK